MIPFFTRVGAGLRLTAVSSGCSKGKFVAIFGRQLSPLSPALLMLVYETLHARLIKEFLAANFFVHVDDIAIVTKTDVDLQQVPKKKRNCRSY